jgi:uncharacterized protein DUF6081
MPTSGQLITQRAVRVYDDFSAAGLDSRRWTVVEVTDADGHTHAYQDRRARIRSGGGSLEIAVRPFTRFHDTVPMLNNVKQMYRSTERIAVRPDTEITVATDMTIQTYRQIPFDPLDAFGALSLVDFGTGTLLQFAATNDTVYAVLERLLLPGVTTAAERFVHRVVLDVDTSPGREHHYAISYRSDSREATWQVDGERVYWARTPARIDGFHLAMGLLSARDMARYSRAEREHGQGATGRWGPWRITTYSREGMPR